MALHGIPPLGPIYRAANDAEPDRPRQLIDAANALLEEGGLEGLTIRAVLHRTGLARRALYDSFASKDDLVVAVFEETLRKAAVQFRAQTDAATPPLGRIESVVVGLVMGTLGADEETGHLRVTAMVREHLRLAQTRPAQLQAGLQPLLDFIAEQVAAGIRRGQLRECDPDLQAMLIYNMVATTMHTKLMAGETDQPARWRKEQLAEEIWEFCRRAIVA